MKTLHRTSIILSCLLALCAVQRPARAQDGGRVRAILQKAVAAPKDQAALKERLQEIDTELARNSNLALGHYTRGWILSHAGRNEESVAAYDRATALDPKFGDAWYNAGVVLHGMGRDQEALDRWRAALKADPSNADAAYNLGQVSYNRRDFTAALDYWQRARTLVPEDFGAAKKVLQAQNALARWEDAEITRREVFRLHKESKDPKVRALTEYAFDQFDVATVHVFAYETFEPAGEDAVLYTFRATRPDRKIWGQVAVVRPGQALVKVGPCRLEVKVGKEKVGNDIQLTTLPDYPALKERVRVLVREHILPVVK